MSWAIILAVIDGTESSEAALAAALALGRDFSARVDLLHVEPDVERSVPVVGEGLSGAAVEQILQSLQREAAARLEAAKGLYQKRCVEAGLPVAEPGAETGPGKFAVRFHHVVGQEDDEVLKRGRLSDLIVMARPPEGGEGELTPAFDAALFDSGRPVLLVPAGPVADFGATIAVAWTRTREAARAAAAALPLLAKAGRVIVLTGREGAGGAEPSDLAGYLAAHGIKARTWAFAPETGSIGKALLGEAKEAGADLMVMGAYGHSRLREMVLGGATRDVLDRAAIPVLLVH